MDLDYDSSEEEENTLARQIDRQCTALQLWVSESRNMLTVAACSVTKGIAAAAAPTSTGRKSRTLATTTTTTGTTSMTAREDVVIGSVLGDLDGWLIDSYPDKRRILSTKLLDLLDDLKASEEGKRMDVETLVEKVDDLETAMKGVHSQVQNLRDRLLVIQKTNMEHDMVMEEANKQLSATQSMSAPPTPFTEGQKAAAAAAGRVTGPHPSSHERTRKIAASEQLSLDDLLAQVEQQNLKYEALQSMRTDGEPLSPSTSVESSVRKHAGNTKPSASRANASINSLLENPNVKKATDDVRTFFSTFGSKMKAATSDGLKHVRKAADDSKSQFQKVRRQLSGGGSVVDPHSPESGPAAALFAKLHPTKTHRSSANDQPPTTVS